jgi:4-carboxymuconolactone decarboxylase
MKRSQTMLPPDPPARMPQIQPEDVTDDVNQFLTKWTGGIFNNADKNPVLLTLAHHPKLADPFSQFNIHLLSGNTLPVKQRQIAIMRTAWICKATYMWSSHLRTTVRAGVSTDIFKPIQSGADDPYFTEFERVLMRATDELVNDKKVSDANWQALMAEWNNQQMLDFLFTVGGYVTIAGVMRSAGVERQTHLLELAEQYGAPE